MKTLDFGKIHLEHLERETVQNRLPKQFKNEHSLTVLKVAIVLYILFGLLALVLLISNFRSLKQGLNEDLGLTDISDCYDYFLHREKELLAE